MTKAHSHLKSVNRRQAIFSVSIILIGLLFVASVIALLTGQFRPTADEPTGGDNGAQDTSVVIRDGVLTYKDPQGNEGRVGINSVTLSPQAATLTASFALQGLNGKLDRVPVVDGTIKVYQGTTLLGQANWTSRENEASSTSRRRLVIDNPALLQIINSNTGPFHFWLKPNYYLSVMVRNVTDPSLPISFGEAGAGDFNNNDHVYVEDASIAAAEYDQPVTEAKAHFDLNRDGRTFNVPDASIFASNYDKRGEQP